MTHSIGQTHNGPEVEFSSDKITAGKAVTQSFAASVRVPHLCLFFILFIFEAHNIKEDKSDILTSQMSFAVKGIVP